MGRWDVVICLVALLTGLWTRIAVAQSLVSREPTPAQEDATLRDVTFVGERLIYTVGDRGVVWKSSDAGRTWEFVPTPTNATLEAVCFLTDRVGWAGGGDILPGSRMPIGVLLATQDGGHTWSPVETVRLPYITALKFFDLDEGILCGPATWDCPTGVMSTSDGGQTWKVVDGPPGPGWRTGDFVDRHTGVVGGRAGRNSVIGNSLLLPDRVSLGLRTVRDVSLQHTGMAWMVGDGGLILRSTQFGSVWELPEQRLPREWERQVDLHGVAAHEQSVWIAGRPGSVIWHSPDGGRSWQRQQTPVSQPLQAIAMAGRRGCAVGSLGTILITEDGQTWEAVRGGERRTSILAVHAYPHRVSMSLTTRYGLEEGYRSVAIIPVREDIGPAAELTRNDDLRLQAAFVAAGGNHTSIGWELPLTLPGMQHQPSRLVEEWQLLTDDDLGRTILSKLTLDIRMWRPDLVVIEKPLADDAPARILEDAVHLAVSQAADPNQSPEQGGLGLSAWKVSRVVTRLPQDQRGSFRLNLFDPLVRHGTSLRVAAEPAWSRLIPGAPHPLFEEYAFTESTNEGGGSLFSGLTIPPGSPSRRPLAPLTDLDERVYRAAEHQRHLAGYFHHMLDDPVRSAQVTGQLRDLLAPLNRAESAIQLQDLAQRLGELNQWDLVEEVLVVLMANFPGEPAAQEAMAWLFHRWSSEEVSWQRLRRLGTTSVEMTTNRDVIQMSATSAALPTDAPASAETGRGVPINPVFPRGLPASASPSGQGPAQDSGGTAFIQQTGRESFSPLTGLNAAQRERERLRWLQQAQSMAQALEQASPDRHASPDIQLALASLLDRQGASTSAIRIRESILNRPGLGSWQQSALGEMWVMSPQTLSPCPVVPCVFTNTPPFLDGVLDDPIWKSAIPAHLSRQAPEPGHIGFADSRPIREDGRNINQEMDEQHAHARFAWDAHHFYLSLVSPVREGQPEAAPRHAGRTHDADLRDYDRWILWIDTDRDHATFYELQIDQRGWTSDRCWVDSSWNPQWHVAAERSRTGWTVEAAIPWEELVPTTPRPGTVWRLGLMRITPGVGIESWSFPHAETPLPEGLGLLRFTAAQP